MTLLPLTPLKESIYSHYNQYVRTKYDTTTLHTYTTLTTQETLLQLFNKIDATDISSRNLELFLPLFFLADMIDYFVLDELIETAKIITEHKKEDEQLESVDVIILEFISKKEQNLEYHSIKELLMQFQEYSEERAEWMTLSWFGRALKRLNLIINKRRLTHGREVILDVLKAKKQLLLFKK